MNKHCLYYLPLLLIFCSCMVYRPVMTDIPLLEEKNDIHIAGGIDFYTAGAEISAAYAPFNHVGVQVAGHVHSDWEYYTQVAVGYFLPFGDKNVFECYGGYAYSKEHADYDAKPATLNGYNKLAFLQINYGRTNSKFAHADYGISLKPGYLHSEFTDNNYYNLKDEAGNSITEIIGDHLLLEPNIFLRLGWEHLKFSIKAGYCYITNSEHYSYWPINFGVGLYYSF